MTHLLTLYFLDSGAYSSGIQDWFGIFHASDYDYLRQDQIDWFLQESCTSLCASLLGVTLMIPFQLPLTL